MASKRKKQISPPPGGRDTKRLSTDIVVQANRNRPSGFALLKDISRTGLGVVLYRRFEKGELLHFSLEKDDLHFYCQGKIMRIRRVWHWQFWKPRFEAGVRVIGNRIPWHFLAQFEKDTGQRVDKQEEVPEAEAVPEPAHQKAEDATPVGPDGEKEVAPEGTSRE